MSKTPYITPSMDFPLGKGSMGAQEVASMNLPWVVAVEVLVDESSGQTKPRVLSRWLSRSGSVEHSTRCEAPLVVSKGVYGAACRIMPEKGARDTGSIYLTPCTTQAARPKSRCEPLADGNLLPFISRQGKLVLYI